MGFWNVIFYGLIAVVGITAIAVTYYRIDWARHPEKYKKDLEDLEKQEKAEYWKKKNAEKAAAEKKAKDKEKAKKQQARIDKLNELRAINGKGPLTDKNGKSSKKK